MAQAPVLSADAVQGGGARRALLAGRPGARGAARSAAARELAGGGLRRRHGPGWRAGCPSGWIRPRCWRARARSSRWRSPTTAPPARPAPIARYARGRDYHYAHRDRMKDLRKRLLALDPTLETYAVRRHGRRDGEGLGRARRAGLDRQERLPHQPAARVVADAVGDVRRPRGRRLRRARRAALRRLHALPGRLSDGRVRRRPASSTRAAASPTTASRTRTSCRRRCATGFAGRDLRLRRLPGGLPLEPPARSPRATAGSRRGRCRRWRPPRSPRWRPDEFERLAAGMAVARARYDGLRRNALYAIGSRPRPRRPRRRGTSGRRSGDAIVRDAAGWALERLGRRPRR